MDKDRIVGSAKDFAGKVETDDHRERYLDTGHAAHREHIVVVERGRFHPDDDMAFANHGIGKVPDVLQAVEVAVPT